MIPAIFAAFVFVVVLAPAADAHVELVTSEPVDGATVEEAPDTIRLTFSVAADPAGDGIVLYDALGDTVPASVDQPTPEVIVVAPTNGLGDGVYSLTWTMKAGDAHPRSGAVSFSVASPVTAGGGGSTPGAAPIAGTTGTPQPAVADASESPSSVIGDWLGRIGRWSAMLGALIGIGAFAFAATSLIGTRREVQRAGYWVRRAGVLVLAGTAVEVLGASMVLGGGVFRGLAPWSLLDVLSGAFGIAILLRVVGGAAMVQGTAIMTSESAAPLADPTSLRLGGDGSAVATALATEPRTQTYRLDIHHSVTALIGVVLVVASYLFDGHTVTAAPAPIVRAANVAHVFAAGVWVGGVLFMGRTLAARRRQGIPIDAAAIAIRFSRVAAVALAVVGVAGLALTWTILDTPTELISTTWGRVLMVKLLAVALAAAMGAYNHFTVIPALESNPADEVASDRLRQIVGVEGGVLLAVVAVTAILVGAAS